MNRITQIHKTILIYFIVGTLEVSSSTFCRLEGRQPIINLRKLET